jgi:hypothetical protein
MCSIVIHTMPLIPSFAEMRFGWEPIILVGSGAREESPWGVTFNLYLRC